MMCVCGKENKIKHTQTRWKKTKNLFRELLYQKKKKKIKFIDYWLNSKTY